jgi:hypothetical protein
VVRGDDLAVACGAVTDVPLGKRVTARVVAEEIWKAKRVFKDTDGKFRFPELSVAVSVGNETRSSRAAGQK